MTKIKYFFYSKTYKSKSDKRKDLILRLKQKVFFFLLKNDFLKKKLDPVDRIQEYKEDREIHIAKNYYSRGLNKKSRPESYKQLKLPYISFLEVIEIDKFDHFKKNLISKFSSKHSGFGMDIRYKEELKEKLSKIKIDLDTSGYGKLISLNFKKLKPKHSDLIDLVNISYLKTNESYFVLLIEITTSKKFKKIESNIFESPDTDLSIRHFNSVKNILKHRFFMAHTTFSGSLARKNIDNLIFDLEFQIKHNILRHLKGYFFTSNLSFSIPRIEHYTIKNFKNLKENNSLYSFLQISSKVQFTSPDELVDIYIDEENNKVFIIKEEKHQLKENSKNDMSDYDRLESYFLMQSMSFPCIFESILNEEFSRLNHIKRKMYDFLENTNKWSFYKSFLLFKQNNCYLKLKKEITKLNLITNRYKNEFNKNSLNFLINHGYEINDFQYSDKNWRKSKELNLSDYYIKKFTSQINHLSKKKEDVNDIFRNIEELNNYRTNFILQIVSLIVGILAFIFAFEKVQDYIILIFNN